MKEIIMSVKDLYVIQNNRPRLSHVTFDLAVSQVLCVVGAKNSGQDFLLRAIAGDFPAQQIKGGVSLVGDCRTGYVSESLRAVQCLSIFQNLSLILKFIGIQSQTQLGETVESVLRRVHLWSYVKNKLHEPVSDLSHLEQLKLNLARTLILQPKVLLLNDPTPTLDVVEKNAYEKTIESLKETLGVIWVTYDLQQAGRVSDQLMYLHNGQMMECGSSEELFTTPAHLETENFLSRRFYV